MDLDSVELLENEAKKMGCIVIHHADLKKYTTFKIGGKSQSLIEINSVEACQTLIPLAESLKIKYYIFGKGSNLIVDDTGIDAVIFRMSSYFSDMFLVDDTTIFCNAGASLLKLCLFALENSLSGLEFAYGIPGSVGGAVYMNAGAYGGEIKNAIYSAEAIDINGDLNEYLTDDMDLSYRHSVFADNKYIITSAVFKLKKADKEEIKTQMDKLMEQRHTKQPLEYPSAGSTFKRPEGSYASLLIEQCGLKGLSVGDAEVSTKHSGFVINKGNSTFDEVMELINQVRIIVKEKTGYMLECEPEIITDREDYKA